MLIVNFQMVSIFLAHHLISFKRASFKHMSLDPQLTIYHSNIGDHIIVVLNLSMST